LLQIKSWFVSIKAYPGTLEGHQKSGKLQCSSSYTKRETGGCAPNTGPLSP